MTALLQAFANHDSRGGAAVDVERGVQLGVEVVTPRVDFDAVLIQPVVVCRIKTIALVHERNQSPTSAVAW